MAETTVTLESTLSALIEGKKYAALRDILVTMNPADVAAVFEETDELALPLLFRLLPKELAAETFVEMQPEQQELLIRGFSDTELKEVVDELYVDDAVDLVEEMPANVVKRILRQADPDMRRMINEILRYPEDSAGSIMTTEFVSLRPQMTVEEATKRIKRTGVDKETINTCYVIDKGRLIGALSLRTLILSDDDDVIEDIMEPNVISVTTSEDQETVAQMFSKYNFNALPVVDTENRLVGIVTVDDAIDVMEEEATEDIEKMAAIVPSEHSYMKRWPVWRPRSGRISIRACSKHGKRVFRGFSSSCSRPRSQGSSSTISKTSSRHALCSRRSSRCSPAQAATAARRRPSPSSAVSRSARSSFPISGRSSGRRSA